MKRQWLRLWPGMQDEVVMLTDDEVISALGYGGEPEADVIRIAAVGDWVCDPEGYYIRLANGPLFGSYMVPR